MDGAGTNKKRYTTGCPASAVMTVPDTANGANMEAPVSPEIIIVMGVAGSGKTTIGKMLADFLNWSFEDADDFHPVENVEKMSLGIALSDQDRMPWLESLRNSIKKHLIVGTSTVLACSALKASYREILQVDDRVALVYLKGNFELFDNRLNSRKGHFMKSTMLLSQFSTLEEPPDALIVDAALQPKEIVDYICRQLKLASFRSET